jgi:hypothetical protein
MVPKTKTLQLTGFFMVGEATINMWGGGRGTVMMDKVKFDHEPTEKEMKVAVNDGRFGCESIESVEAELYADYDGHTEFVSSYTFEKPHGKRGI